MMDPSNPSIGVPRFQTKQDIVYHALRMAIIKSSLAPGTRLVIEDIARQHRVSSIPVREALYRLEREHLVEIRPHAGATVSTLSVADVDEVFALMEALEALVAAPAALHRTDEDVSALGLLADRLDFARNAGDHEAWLGLNIAFHSEFCRIAHMPVVAVLLTQVFDRWERLRRQFFHASGIGTARADAEHRVMIAALADRDGIGLERLIREHNRAARPAYGEVPMPLVTGAGTDLAHPPQPDA